jgi:hypothetical protein
MALSKTAYKKHARISKAPKLIQKKTKKTIKQANHSMNMTIKIGTLNLCLGLKNKRYLVKKIVIENKIYLQCMHKTKIEINFDSNLKTFTGFICESEINDSRFRVGTYVNSSLDYVRRWDLENVNSHIVIVDVKASPHIHIHL